jgi:hypothetical protein
MEFGFGGTDTDVSPPECAPKSLTSREGRPAPHSSPGLEEGDRPCAAVRDVTWDSDSGVGSEVRCRCNGLKKSHKVLRKGPAVLPCWCIPDPRPDDGLPEGGRDCFRGFCGVMPWPDPSVPALVSCRLLASGPQVLEARCPLPDRPMLPHRFAVTSPALFGAPPTPLDAE